MARRKQYKMWHSLWQKMRRKQPQKESLTLQQPNVPLRDGRPEQLKKSWMLRRFFLLRERLRQRRRIRRESFVSPAKIKMLRRKIRPCILVLCLVVLLAVADLPRLGAVFRDVAMFKVHSLHIEGCEVISAKKITRLAGITPYQSSLLELGCDDLASRIEQEDWIQQAVVVKKWPDEIEIKITERKPIALVSCDISGENGLFYVDEKGTLFHRLQPGDDLDYPVITGQFTIEQRDKQRDVFADFTDIKMFLEKVAQNNPNLPEQSISEIHLDEKREMVVYLVDHPFPIFFGKGNIVTKYSRLAKVMASLYHEKESDSFLSGISYIQMDYLHDKVLVAR